MTFNTDQEAFWAGEFGVKYIERNNSDALLASNLNFFSKVLRGADKLKSCIEFGANIGMNLKALSLLYPGIDAFAIEINERAVEQLIDVIPSSHVYQGSIFDFNSKDKWDLVLIKGVLIHLNPEFLSAAYEKLYAACGRYLLLAEYYNPFPVTVPYRGHTDRLFKRDFAGELMTLFPQLQLVDYGFAYHRDPSFPQDDITWFLMEKR